MDLIEELLALAGVPLDETERLDEMKEKDAGEEIRVGEFPTLKNGFSDLILKLPENPDDIGNHIKNERKNFGGNKWCTGTPNGLCTYWKV